MMMPIPAFVPCFCTMHVMLRSPLVMIAAGGSGKTTLAQELHNVLSGMFLQTAYVELGEQGKPECAQQKVLTSLGAAPRGSSVAELKTQLQDCVRMKMVLLVIDNVWTAEQLDALLPQELHEGSTVICTSRSKEIPESISLKNWIQVRLAAIGGAVADELIAAVTDKMVGVFR
jgi:hypothetical protein